MNSAEPQKAISPSFTEIYLEPRVSLQMNFSLFLLPIYYLAAWF